MHLKTLTIKGFKSFASSTTLRLEPGITAVVGPNGSGKSNVVDALTWVMGEQGAKNLRGGSMADVIFAGAGSRPALGRAEVSLTIDNTDGALPIDYTEVTISRTLFRGGGSEYRINGSQCRLLDVQELLSDTGLGRQMHSIVGQGRLDAVLSATPEDRRGFIEEAAGVLKHRKRKERALRKLESMAADLARVADLAQELRRQLGPLARQAAVARRARGIQIEVRDASARLLADDVVQAQGLLEAGQEDAADLARRRAEAEEAERSARARLGELAQAEAACDQRLSQATEVREELTAAAQDLSALAQVAAERVRLLASAPAPARGTDPEELERRALAAATEEDRLARAVQAARSALEEATGQRAGAEAAETGAEQHLASLQRQEAEHRETLARAGGRLASARSRHEASQAALAQARSALEAARQRQERAEAALSRAPGRAGEQGSGQAGDDGGGDGSDDGGNGSDGDNGGEGNDGVGRDGMAGGCAAQRAARAHEEATAALSRAREAVSAATETRREAASHRATWTTRRDTLALSLRSRDGTAQLLEAGVDGLLGPLAEHIEVERGWENAVAALLRDLAGAGLARDADAADEALDHARAHDSGAVSLVLARGLVPPRGAGDRDDRPVAGAVPATALVTTGQPGLAGVLAHLLDGAWVVEDMGAARRARRELAHAVIATRQGDVLAPGWVAGAGRGSSSVLELAAAHEQAQGEAEAAARAEAAADAALQSARADEEAARRREAQALAALRLADAEAARAAEAAARLASAAHAAAEETGRAQRVLERARAEALERTAELAAATTALAELEGDGGAAGTGSAGGAGSAAPGDELERAGAARAEAAEAARRARAQETEARLALRTAEERERSSRGRADSLRSAARMEREQRAAAQRAEAARTAQLAAATHVRDQARAAAEAARTSAAQAAEQRGAIEQERARAVADTGGVREQIDAVVKDLAALSDAAHRREVARAEQRMRLEALAERAMGELGMDLGALVEEYGPHLPVPDTADLEEREAPGPREAPARDADRADRADSADRADREGRDPDAPGARGRPYVRAEQEKRLARATRDLARLGRVNPLALEEHAALEQRHQFLAEQLADLKRSREDLLSIVAEIDARVQEAFALAFQDTAREFAGVFDRLFPGGQGRLVLTEPEDMLTTGIDIEARPAGKKVKRLSLLSGGERSLAAVALLVAIFKARPSPFYVMDEVEAALDDTNLGRLLEIFTELRASSQLIIITHQKRTMEVADALYGITMREGITKAVSQRLARE